MENSKAMAVINRIAEFYEEMKTWRRHIHSKPEVGFECFQTADFIKEMLVDFGVDEIHEGWAKTGVVAIINGKGEGGNIALRADMDALPMDEKTNLEYTSTHAGAMHACGHDGHTTMLLGAAKYLAETRNFSGRVILVFQPAEEAGGGAGVMVEEGLIENFNIEHAFALHNLPDLEIGKFETTAGPLLASVDDFEITIHGRGGHAAHPDHTVDPILVSVNIVQALQSIISRNVDPLESGVLSITKMNIGTANNVISNNGEIVGTIRAFQPAVRKMMISRLKEIVENVAIGFGATSEVRFLDGYPSTINHPESVEFAANIARKVVGNNNVNENATPTMGAEDFAFILQKCKGAYLYIGNGESEKLHNEGFDFNDEISPIGASYFVGLVEASQPLKS